MKRLITLSFVFMCALGSTFAQLTGTKTIPGDYASLAAAVTDLNTAGVGAGGVTFNIAAGYTETAPAGGIVITATGTSGNPIIFQKSGAGANPIISRTDAGTNTTSSIGGLGDAVISLNSGDYITFNGIDVSASASTIEYGYFTSKTATDACKNITITNCNVTMTKGTSGYVIGIYISNGPTAVGSATGVTVTAAGGTSENFTVTGNTISNVHAGIYVRGSSAAGFNDNNLIIGQSGAGNTIQNFGGGSSTTTYGVYMIYQSNVNVSYNTINNAGGGGTDHAATLYGIFNSSVGAAGNCYYDRNTITLGESGTAAAHGIVDDGNHLYKRFSYNKFSYGSFGSTSSTYMISCTSGTPNIDVIGNKTIGAISKTGASGLFYCYYNNGSPSSGTQTIINNNFSNITVTGSSTFRGISSTAAVGQSTIVSNDTLSSITIGTGTGYGIYVTLSNPLQINNNLISNITSGGTLYGVSFAGTNANVYNNLVKTLSSSGTSVYALYAAATGTTNCYKNNIYDISSSNSAPSVYGIYVNAGTAIYVSNNFVSDLRTPSGNAANTINGIYISGGTDVGLFNNSIYLNASSSGVTFGSSGIYASTTPNVSLINNIVANNSTAQGTGGYAVAYRRSSTTLTSYGSTSNNNCFYAGTPSATNLIFYDGTNSDQTMAAYKTRVSARDNASFSELPPFVNVAATPYDLHLQTTIATQCESGGTRITTPIAVTTDYDGDIRYGETGYVGSGSAPDVGADEGNFISLDLFPPTITYTALTNTTLTTARILTATISDLSGVPTIGAGLPVLYWKINAGAYSAVTGTWISGNQYSFTFGAGVVTGDVVSYYVAAQDNATTPNVTVFPLTGASGFSANPPAAATPTTAPSTYTIVTSISGAVTVGTSGTYPSLTGAGGLFADINSKVVTGNITATIISDLTEDGTNALNQFAKENAGTHTLLITSDGVGEHLVSGAVANAMIRINGADSVAFNGLASKQLRFRNTNTANPTFSFLNDADYNVITNSIIEGANTTSTSGIILISTTTGTIGNDYIEISNCDIRDRSDAAGVPANLIYNAGSAANPNDYVKITGNNFYNFSGNGISCTSTGTGSNWDISGNSFYTTLVTPPSTAQTSINFVPGTASNNNNISGNYIGGMAPACGGTPWVNSGAITFSGIIANVGTVTATSIQNNVIQNISLTSTGSAGINGITVTGGNANIGTVTGNTIGHATNAGSILQAGSSAGRAIYNSGSGNVNIQNNLCANITSTSTTATVGLRIIEVSSGIANITNNIIRDISVSNISNWTDYDAAVLGIENRSSTAGQIIDNNQIYNLTSTNTASTNSLTAQGIRIAAGTGTVSRNSIYNLFNQNTGSSAKLYGINIVSGTWSVLNNLVAIGQTVGEQMNVSGIYAAGGTTGIYYNSVNISGTATAGSNNSFAYNKTATAVTTIKNNIFRNVRTGGTGLHYAIYLTNTTTLNENYNDLFVSGTALGRIGTTDYADLTAWKTGSSKDTNSISADPLFTSVTNLQPLNCSPVFRKGVDIATITTSYNGVVRTNPPDIGAYQTANTLYVSAVTPANPLCPGNSNGSITVTATGGTSPYQYSIDNGATWQSSAIFSGLAANSYTIQVKDQTTCTVSWFSNPVTLTDPAAINISAATTTSATCNGGSDGSITVTATGGTGALQYSKDNGSSWQAGNVFTGLTANSYTIKVKDANNCEVAYASNPVVVSEPTAVAISNVAATPTTCNGANDGTITITAAGGTGALHYSIDNGTSWSLSNVFSALVPNSYTIKVKDDNNCTVAYASNPVIVTDAAALAISNVAATEPLCHNGATGTITITANGGTGSLQYSVDNGTSWQSSNAFTGLNFGSYSVKIKDANNCTLAYASNPVVLVNPTQVVVSNVSKTDLTSCLVPDGIITVTAAGGTGTLNYSIDSMATWQAGNSFTALNAGNYFVFAKDANGCTAAYASNPVSLVTPAAVIIDNIATTNNTCFGSDNATITISASAGTLPYTYSINGGLNYYSNGGVFTNLTPGNYNVYVKDASTCITVYSSNPVVITEPDELLITTGKTDVLCNGGSTGVAGITVTGGTMPYNYSWSPVSSANDTIFNLAAGTYSVQVTDDHSCVSTADITITEPSAISISAVTPVDVLCYGDNTGSITITANGGTGGIQYSIDNGGTFMSGLYFFPGLIADSYIIKVKDGNNCELAYASNPVVLTQPATAVAISNVATVNNTCYGGNTGSLTITANGGTGAFQYSIDNGSTWQSSDTFNGLIAGNYTVKVKDANNCELAYSGNPVVITEPVAITYAGIATTSPLCNGLSTASLTVSASGGTGPLQYSIDNGTTWQSGNAFNGLLAGSYTVVVKDSLNCEVPYASNPVVITEPAAIAVTNIAVVDVLCYGNNTGSINITANGGSGALSYSIDSGATYQLSHIFNGLIAGNYDVMIKDTNSCVLTYASNPVAVTEPAAPLSITNVVATDVHCYGVNDGTITITATGGTEPYSYSINNGATWQNNGGAYTGLFAASRNIMVKDANGCTATWASNPVTITMPAGPIVISSVLHTNVLCNGGTDGTITITATGGTPGFTYSIDNGVSYLTSNVFTGLVAGSYNVKVKDSNECVKAYASNPVVITEPALPVTISTVTATDLTCNNGFNGVIEITANGGTGALQYSSDNGVTWGTSNIITGLSAGNHYIRVKDANGCIAIYAENPVVLNEPNPIIITGVTSANVVCHGGTDGTIEVSGIGGTGMLQFSIDSASTWQTGFSFSGLTAGTYYVMVKDDNGCIMPYASNPVVITEPAAVSITNVAVTQNLCNSGNDGVINITATGGTGILDYSINNGLSWISNGLFNGLSAGTYNIKVRDENFCTVNYSGNPVVLADPDPIVIENVDSTNSTCYGCDDATIQVVAYGGTGALQYSVDNGTTWQYSNLFIGLIPGGYYVQVRDANGCIMTYPNNPVVITEPSGIEENQSSAVSVYPNPTSGEITITGTTKDEILSIEILTIEGKLMAVIPVEEFVANNMTAKYVFAQDVDGVYFVRMITNNNVYMKKITVN